MVEFIPISHDEILKETNLFRAWSGPSLVKIFYSDNGLYPLGSGGLLKYKERFFVVTNEHVIRAISNENRKLDIVILYKDENKQNFKLTVICENEDRENDLAALEVDPNSVRFMNNQFFIDETFMETDLESYLKLSNVVFLHGYPFEKTEIDHDKKDIIITSQCLATTIEGYDEYADLLILHIDETFISEAGITESLQSYSGMSGSLVYGYYTKGFIPYKCIGILTSWLIHEKQLLVLPMNIVIGFLENKFF